MTEKQKEIQLVWPKEGTVDQMVVQNRRGQVRSLVLINMRSCREVL